MSIFDSLLPRAEVQHQFPISCLTWKPRVTMRPSRNPIACGASVKTEDLLVGDEAGNVYFYSVEWPETWAYARDGWAGSMTLLAKISIHTQQICGLSFSCDGYMFATGGNDNLCCIFQTNGVLQDTANDYLTSEEVVFNLVGVCAPLNTSVFKWIYSTLTYDQ
jgi:meiosis-specific APC/C activator protein AMA1